MPDPGFSPSVLNPFCRQGTFVAPVHHVPNLCLGKWGVQNMVRVLIPELYNKETPNPVLSQEQQAVFYEDGLRPAIVHLLGARANEWPPSYADEMFRARGHSGQLSFQTKVIPAGLIPHLGDSIRHFLEENGHPWAEGLVFLHQIRGVKNANAHGLSDEAAEYALERFLRENQLDPNAAMNSDSFWVDVGLEISSSQQRCLAWMNDSHYHVVRACFGLDSVNARRITRQGSSKYARDITNHLSAVAGCRIEPGVRGQGTFEVQYFQMYTTDKALIYRLDQGHHGKFLKGQDILKRGKASSYLKSLFALYVRASEENSSSARMEGRVPIRYARRFFLNVGEELLRDSLVSFRRKDWWYVAVCVSGKPY